MGRVASSTAAAVWRRRLARWRQSGLSLAEFCRREDVSPASFYAWRKRLAKSGKTNAHARQAPPRPLFVPVELDLAERSDGGVQIELPGGAVVRLPAGASSDLVVTAIRAAMHAALTVDASAEEASPC